MLFILRCLVVLKQGWTYSSCFDDGVCGVMEPDVKVLGLPLCSGFKWFYTVIISFCVSVGAGVGDGVMVYANLSRGVMMFSPSAFTSRIRDIGRPRPDHRGKLVSTYVLYVFMRAGWYGQYASLVWLKPKSGVKS